MLVKNEKIVYNKEKYKNKYKNMAELVNKPKQKEPCQKIKAAIIKCKKK